MIDPKILRTDPDRVRRSQASRGESVEGIVSERDVVRALAARGAAVLAEPVAAIATTQVIMPSIMKIHRHPRIPARPSICMRP